MADPTAAKPRSLAPTAKASSAHEHAAAARAAADERLALSQYGRGKAVRHKSIKDKRQRHAMKALEQKYKTAAVRAKDAEVLLEHESGLLEAEDELERTWRVRQDEIRSGVAVETARKGFELRLEDGGPYKARYSRTGRDLLLAGRKGHIATMNWRDGALGCEVHLNETVRDATWLHNNLTFAVAQKKYTYIYDQNGVELHRLDKHIEAQYMEFLPYHFLLATIGNSGHLVYTDTSTGQMVQTWPTKLGTPTSFTQNSWNAMVHVGHQNGTVTMWSPNVSTPEVKLLAHKGPVRSMAVDREGRYMVSAGSDMKMAVWDIRMFKPVNTYFLRQPGSSIDISDRNLTAVSWGTQVTIWQGLFDKNKANQEKVQSPYMAWGGDGLRPERVKWCPFEDILGVSHDKGFTSAIVPGAGEPNFDALEVNPYETRKQRQEGEVKQLLNKLQPGMISLNPGFVGKLDVATHEVRQREKDLDRKPEDKIEQLKNRARGRNSALKRYMRKKGGKNIIDERKVRIEELKKQNTQREKERREKQKTQYGPALSRFAQKGAGG